MEKLELILDFGKCMASIVTVTCFVLKRIRGRRIYNPYALFEALKVRDFGSNRYNVTATMKKSVRIRRNHLVKTLDVLLRRLLLRELKFFQAHDSCVGIVQSAQ